MRRSTFKTETRPRRSTFKTETFQFFKLSRLRRDRDVEPSRPRRDERFNLQDRDETDTFQKRLETALRPRRSRPRLHPCYNVTKIAIITSSTSATSSYHNHDKQGQIQGVHWVRTNTLRDKEIFEAILVGRGLNLVR